MNTTPHQGPAPRRVLRPRTLALLIGAVGASIIAISCATLQRVVVAPPMIPGATYVGLETCGTCHERQVKGFKLTAHARVTIPGEGERVEGQGCEGCHGPGSLHVEAGGGKGKFILAGKDNAACFQCHLDKNAEFSLPYHHQVKEGRLTCTACHNPHGENIHLAKGMAVGRVNETCAQCHREQSRPHVFEHEAMREGCVACHNPHGSINDKMLTERDANLCLKCHAQVALPNTGGSTMIGKFDHTPFLKQGTCFSAGCHTAVHGSDINSHLRY